MAGIRTKAGLETSLRGAGFTPEQVAQISGVTRPAVRFDTVPADDGLIAPGLSKLSGLPDFAPGQSWPIRPAYSNAQDKLEYLQKEREGYQSGRYAFLPDVLIPFELERITLIETILTKPFPLFFIAQIDFAEVAGANPDLEPYIPREGRLSFFYDLIEQPWGFDPADRAGFQLLWSEPDEGPLLRAEPPAELVAYLEQDRALQIAQRDAAAEAREAQQNRGFIGRLLAGDEPDIYVPDIVETLAPSHRMSPAAQVSFPDLYGTFRDLLPEISQLHAEGDETDLLIERWYEEANLIQGGDQVGGWPYVVQSPGMGLEAQLVSNGIYLGDASGYQSAEAEALRAGAADWVFLAQIDSNDSAWMWGDSGLLYIWIRKQDLAARDFDKAWVILQSY